MGTSQQTNTTVPETAPSTDPAIVNFYTGIAKFLGKAPTDTFTQGDLDRLLDVVLANDPFKGTPLDFTRGVAQAYFQGWVNQPINTLTPSLDWIRIFTVALGTSVTGGNAGATQPVLDNTSKALQFLTNPANWLLILAGFGGILLVVVGGRKALDNG